MQKFDDLFGVVFGERILKHKDNLSKHYSKSTYLSAGEAQGVAELRNSKDT